MRLVNKLAVITAAASGMGRAGCQRFLEEGAAVVAIDINREALDALVADLGRQGRTIVPIVADLSKAVECRRAIKEAAEKLGGIDILWNHAGSPGTNKVEGLEQADYDFDMALNIDSSVVMTGEAIPHMRSRGGGSLLYTASISGLFGSRRSPVYAAGKFAVVGFAKSVALRYGPEKIRANVLCPGLVDTPMKSAFVALDGDPEEVDRIVNATLGAIPLQRIAEPLDVAHAAVFLASDEASYITGTTLTIDGGQTAV